MTPRAVLALVASGWLVATRTTRQRLDLRDGKTPDPHADRAAPVNVADPAAVHDVIDLLDDLARLVDRALADREPTQRFHGEHATARLRGLRARLALSHPRPQRHLPGDWFTDLSLALGDTTELPRIALTARIELLEATLQQTSRRSRRR